MATRNIKLFDPKIGLEEEKAVLNVLKSKSWASGAGGKYVNQFEKKFKEKINSSDCIAVNSGTAALNLALSLVDIKGKDVILPSLSFVSTAHAVSLNGGNPVFVDVDQDTLCLDPNMIEQSITKRTKLILPVHFAGMPCDMNKIIRLCKRKNLSLIEDAAHASGASIKEKKIGSHGKYVCFSFHPVKNLAMPTGGMIAINDRNHKKIRDTLLARRWCGITNRKGPHYDVRDIGWNYYMNEFSAAIGLIQLNRLNSSNQARKEIAKRFCKELKAEQTIPYTKNCIYHIFWILVKNRKSFMKKMFDFGVETGIHYKPIHNLTYYNKKNNNLPVTDKISEKIVSIPIHPNLSDNDVSFIIKSINKII